MYKSIGGRDASQYVRRMLHKTVPHKQIGVTEMTRGKLNDSLTLGINFWINLKNDLSIKSYLAKFCNKFLTFLKLQTILIPYKICHQSSVYVK